MADPTLAQARRIAVAAQGFGGARTPAGAVTGAHVRRVVQRIGLLQIDSVNVLARAHLLPLFSRLGPYDRALVDRAARGSARTPRRLVEYWAHVAAYVPPETFGLLRFRMERYRTQGRAARTLDDHRDVVGTVKDLLADHGPLTASDMHERLGHDRGPRTHWGWNWTVAKHVLEALFLVGDVAIAGRTTRFERLYDLTERVVPAEILATPAPDAEEAADALVTIALRAHGIGTVRCLADYFRMDVASTRRAAGRLVARGSAERVAVEGWSDEVYLDPAARRPRAVDARALLAPFDPLVFERRRLQDLFGMHYRIGIYTPEARRTHGYYVLPFLLGDRLVGRVDLEADRARGALVVRSAFAEPDAPGATAAALADEIRLCAHWLDLGTVSVADSARGDLVGPLVATL